VLNAVINLQGSSWLITSAPPTSGPATATTAEGATAEHADTAHEGGHCTTECSKDPGPILPEVKELAWGGGSFIVMAVAIRYWLFPKLKRGMDARYQGIRDDHASADAARQSARAEVADYETQLAQIKAEAAGIVEAARNEVEAQRQAKLAEVNARVGEARSAAAAQAEQVRDAAKGQIAAAVGQVASRAGALATGRQPSDEVVNRVVNEVMAR